MWNYKQSTGCLAGGVPRIVALGYAGRDAGKNNPAMQEIKGIGPLPVGLYKMGEPYDHPTVGKYAIPLTPHPDNKMFGRSSFFVHGDSSEHPGLASHGCIVMSRGVRERLVKDGDNVIEVMA